MTEGMKTLDWFESVEKRAKELRAEEAEVKEQIRNGFIECAIVFIDVVGSTAFKQTHCETPEVWILRVRQFSQLLSQAVGSAKGRVVKYIGDEVMAVFDNVFDAQNLVGRISEIESNLHNAIGYETRIKLVADYGSVYFLTFPGHDEPDPQGPAVDRCARIGKYAQPGEVLASADFASKTEKLGWKKAGRIDLKGLGMQVVYQLGHVTVDLEPLVAVKEVEYKSLQGNLQELQFEVQQLIAKNERLVSDLQTVGKQPDANDLATNGDDQETRLEAISSPLKNLNKIISDAPVPKYQYARFLFLWNTGTAARYNAFEEIKFDECIEAGLVKQNKDDLYEIDDNHPRNKKAISSMEQAEQAIADYLRNYDPESDDLYRWSLSDPEFWKKRIGYSVTQF